MKTFFSKVYTTSGLPEKVGVDKSEPNNAVFHEINVIEIIDVIDVKYLNHVVEQSHRPIKQKMYQALGWKSNSGEKATLTGVELWLMIKNKQFDNPVRLSV